MGDSTILVGDFKIVQSGVPLVIREDGGHVLAEVIGHSHLFAIGHNCQEAMERLDSKYPRFLSVAPKPPLPTPPPG